MQYPIYTNTIEGFTPHWVKPPTGSLSKNLAGLYEDEVTHWGFDPVGGEPVYPSSYKQDKDSAQ